MTCRKVGHTNIDLYNASCFIFSLSLSLSLSTYTAIINDDDYDITCSVSMTLGLIFSNTCVLHLHYFKRLYFSLHEFLRCLYSSSGRVTRFLHYSMEEHS